MQIMLSGQKYIKINEIKKFYFLKFEMDKIG